MNLQERIAEAKRILDEGGVSPESVWYQRIVDERVPLSNYAAYAYDWQTCMCGERDTWVEWVNRYEVQYCMRPEFWPLDIMLRKLGGDFYRNVDVSNRIEAARTGVAINQRSIELWAEKHAWPDELKQAAVVPLKTL